MYKEIGFKTVLVIILIFGMTACNKGSRAADLQGKWVEFDEGEVTFTGNNFVWEWSSSGKDGKGTFTVSGGRVTLYYERGVATYRFTVSPDGRMLTLYDTKDEEDFKTFSKK